MRIRTVKTIKTVKTEWIPEFPVSNRYSWVRCQVRKRSIWIYVRNTDRSLTCYIKTHTRQGWLKQHIKRMPYPEPIYNETLGIDLGDNPVIAFSTGEKFYTPRYIFASLRRIKRLKRKLKRKCKYSKNWYETKWKLRKSRRRLSRQISTFLAKPLRIARSYQTVTLENCEITNWLARTFVKRLKKTLRHEQIVWVSPRLNSYTCSHCGSRKVKAIRMKRLRCPQCNKTLDRDVNAAVVGKQRLKTRHKKMGAGKGQLKRMATGLARWRSSNSMHGTAPRYDGGTCHPRMVPEDPKNQTQRQGNTRTRDPSLDEI